MMIDFPEVTRVHRRMPKEAFYKRLQLNKTVKDKFVSDVDRIFVENSLTMENLHLTGRERWDGGFLLKGLGNLRRHHAHAGGDIAYRGKQFLFFVTFNNSCCRKRKVIVKKMLNHIGLSNTTATIYRNEFCTT